MLSQQEYDKLVRDGGCVFEIGSGALNGPRACGKAAEPGKKHCPRHQAELDAKEARKASRRNR